MATNTSEPRRLRRASRRESERHIEDDSSEFSGARPPLRGTPANENEPGSAALLSNLKRRPSAAPFWVAFIVSLIWIFACMAIFGPAIFSEANPFGPGGLTKILTAAMALILPAGLAWAAAYLLYRAQQLRQVSEALMHTAMRLIRPQDIASESLSSIAHTIRQEVSMLVGGVEQAVQRAGQLEEMVHKEMASIERAFGGNEERIRMLIAGLESQREALQQAGFVIGTEAAPLLTRLEENSQHLDGIINAAQGTLASLEHGLKASTDELARTMEDVAARAAMVGDQIGSQSSRMEEMSSILLTDVQGFSDHITHQVQLLSQASSQLNIEGTSFGHSVKSMEDGLLHTLRSSIGELAGLHTDLQRSIDHMTVTVSDQLKTTGQQFTELLDATSSNVTYHLKSTTTEVGQQLERSGMEVSQQIQVSGDDLSQRVLTSSSDFVQNVARARTELFSYLEESSTALTSRLEETTNQLFGKIENVSGQMTDQLVSVTQRVTERLDDTTMRLFENVEQSNSSIFARLDATSNEVSQRLDHAGNSMFIRIDTTARNLGERFDIATQLLERVTSDITGRMESTSTTFAGTLDKTSAALTDKIAGSRHDFAKVLNDMSAGIFAELGKASTAFSEGLSSSTSTITGRFEQTTGHLVGRLDEATGTLQLRTADSANKIDDASEKFANHVQSTNKFFADQLSDAANVLDDRLQSISVQLTGKLETTGTKLSERLEDVSLLVEKSVDRFNSDIERVLHTREDVLGELMGKLGKKADDVDSMMRNYMALIEESLNKADSRSREIGRVIAGQADTAAHNLEHQIKQLEETSDAQIATAARQLREQYERAVNTMNEMLSMTAGEFTQTAQDMRVTAQQVVRDIESARNELRQAILDLPEETRTNAAAMRKVVADQIEALNTLADIVKRQTNTLELSGPGVYVPNRKEAGSAKHEANLPAVPREADQETGKRKSREAEPEPEPTIRGRSVSALLEIEAPEGSSNLLPQLRTEDSALPAARHRKKSDAGSVSRETETIVAKLNGAARDLVEAIDGKLPAELERRFNAGEQHVYTHRLYQGRGKKMLELLTDRYETERLIRGRIDGFVRLFERLLDTVSETPQGEQLVDACLGSESGKLYLMLAQASGRLTS